MKEITMKFLDFILGLPQTEAVLAGGFSDSKEQEDPKKKALDNVVFGASKGSTPGAAPMFVPPPAAPPSEEATLTEAVTPEEEEKRKTSALKKGAKSLTIPSITGAPETVPSVGTGAVPLTPKI